MAFKSFVVTLMVIVVVSISFVAAVPVTVDLNASDQLHIVPAIPEVEDRPAPLRVVVAADPAVHGHQHYVQQHQLQHPYIEQQQWIHRQQQQQSQSLGRPIEPLHHHQQQQQAWQQSNHLSKEQQHQHVAEEAATASHFCIDGRCYALTPTQESAAEHQAHVRTGQEHHRLVKRSMETNDVRQRFQANLVHHQVLQQQQQQMPLQQQQQQAYSSQYQRPTPPPPAPTPAPGQQQQQPSSSKQQSFRGQPVTGRPQHQDRTTTTTASPKDSASSAAFEKAVMDFEKISDKISDMVSTFMIPIVRSSFDEESSVFVIELDYSEATNTAEATVETEE